MQPTLTIFAIRQHKPRPSEIARLRKVLGKKWPDDQPFPLTVMIDAKGVRKSVAVVDTLENLKALGKEWEPWIRLLICAIARTALPFTNDPSTVETISVAERYARGEATEAELTIARAVAWDAARGAAGAAVGAVAWDAARPVSNAASTAAGWDAAWYAAYPPFNDAWEITCAACNAARAAVDAAGLAGDIGGWAGDATAIAAAWERLSEGIRDHCAQGWPIISDRIARVSIAKRDA